jgi:hypothetical protein
MGLCEDNRMFLNLYILGWSTRQVLPSYLKRVFELDPLTGGGAIQIYYVSLRIFNPSFICQG